MNLYLRYFDKETLVQNVDEAIDFLQAIPDIEMTPELERELREYVSSSAMFPKRCKVRPHIYFIVIKTTAATMEDFKQKKAVAGNKKFSGQEGGNFESPMAKLQATKMGWYEGQIDFKRVVMVPETGKFEYRDTHFVADCKAESGMDCYNRIVNYLRDRVDYRSQFPSAKGKNFHFKYLGMWKQN